MSWHRPHFFSRKSKRKSETAPASPDSVSLPGLPSTETAPEVPETAPYSVAITDEDLKKHGFVGKQLQDIKARAGKRVKGSIATFKETPKIERLKTNMTKEEFVDTVKDTRVGSLVGAPAMIVMWPVMGPVYLIDRAMGQDRETAVANSFQLSFKIMTVLALGALALVFPAGTIAAAVLLPIAFKLWKPVDQWTDMDVKEFGHFMSRVQNDPELQSKMVEVGSNVATQVGQAAIAASEAAAEVSAQEAVVDETASQASEAEYNLYLNEAAAEHVIPPDPKLLEAANDAEYDLFVNKEAVKLGNAPTLSTSEIKAAQAKIDAAEMATKMAKTPLLTPDEITKSQLKIKEYKDAQKTLAALVKKKQAIKPLNDKDITNISMDAAKTTANITVRQAAKDGKIPSQNAQAMQGQIDMLTQRAQQNRGLSEGEAQSTVQTFARASPTAATSAPVITRRNPAGMTSTPIALSQPADVLVYSQAATADEQAADSLIASGGPAASQAKGTKIAMLNIRAFLKNKPTYNQFLNWLEKEHEEKDQSYKSFGESNADVMDPADFQAESERYQGEINAYEDYALKIRSRARAAR